MGRYKEAPFGFECEYKDKCPHLSMSTTWAKLTIADFDKDGDIDYIAGNLGLNAIYKASEDEPVTAYASDFDNSGTYDVVLSVFEPDSNGIRHAYPVHARDDLIRQMPFMKDRFPKFSDYAEVTMNQLFTEEELRKAMKLEAVWFASSYIENLKRIGFALRLEIKTYRGCNRLIPSFHRATCHSTYTLESKCA
jgi:hypothetical protein